MCDLFGMNCNEPDRASKSLPILAEKYSSSNPDGWGIAYYDGVRAIVERAPGRAKDNPAYSRTAQTARSPIVIAHLRYKTKGEPCTKNCHPFTRHAFGRNWVFAHNGMVPDVRQHRLAEGKTDSEQVFHELMDYAETYCGAAPLRGLYPAVKAGIRKILTRYRENITLNLLLSDGSVLYAFHHYRVKPLYYLRREKDYGGAFLVSTQKLSRENWRELPTDRLLVVSRGEIVVLSDNVLTAYSESR